jgi:hypothetical protein
LGWPPLALVMSSTAKRREDDMKQRMIRFGMAGVMTAGLLAGAAPAFASHGGGVTTEGPCSAASDWKLSLKPENGRLEVEFEVDQNVVGDTWKVVMADNGTRFFNGFRMTKAPSGSFEVRKLTANQAGPDNVVARARNLSTGETCVGEASL